MNDMNEQITLGRLGALVNLELNGGFVELTPEQALQLAAELRRIAEEIER